MKVVAIVQARMGSTRLPGKVLLKLGEDTVLSCVIRRVRRFRRADDLLIATTTETSDDLIVQAAQSCGAAVFRGSESDVLDRYYQAARSVNADVIVRITSDCPLIDPEVSDYTIDRFLQVRPDYASNVLERTYPRGLDTEVIDFPALECAWREARVPYEREHVTPYLYRRPERFRLLSVTGDRDNSSYRWTLDTPKDLDFLRAVYARGKGSPDTSWRAVLKILQRDPELVSINQNVKQKTE